MVSDIIPFYLFVFRFVEAVRQAALSAVVAVEVTGHEHASATLVSWTFAPQTVDFAIFIHLPKQKASQETRLPFLRLIPGQFAVHTL